MWHLRQSTAVVLSFGPFVDKGDGVTPEVGLVSALDHASTGIKLSKNGGALTIRHAAVTASTYDGYGNYLVTLDTTDTASLGTLRMQFIETATCLPVWADCMVMPANIWDSLYGADLLQVDLTQLGGGTQSATDLKDLADTGYDPSTHKVQGVVLADTVTTYTGNTVQTGDTYARLGAPAGASHSADTAAVKVDTAAVKVQTDKLTFTVSNQIDSNVLDWKSATAPAMTGDAYARIGAAGVSLSAIPDLAGVTTLLSRLSAARAGYLDNVNNATLAGAAFPTDPADASDIAASFSTIASTLATIAAYIDTEVAAIKAKTDLLPSSPAAVGSAMTLTSGERTSIAAAAFVTQMTEAYAADGVAPTLAQALFRIMQNLVQFAVSGTTITVKKLDKSSTAETYTLDSSTAPTSRTRAS